MHEIVYIAVLFCNLLLYNNNFPLFHYEMTFSKLDIYWVYNGAQVVTDGAFKERVFKFVEAASKLKLPPMK